MGETLRNDPWRGVTTLGVDGLDLRPFRGSVVSTAMTAKSMRTRVKAQENEEKRLT
jgi:hypothetical protein